MKEIIADVDFKEVYKSCSVFCEEIKSGSQARHVMTLACQAAIQKFLAHEGPALLDVYTNPVELVMPPEPSFEQVKSTSMYAMRALLAGRVDDVKDLIVNNFIK